MAVIEHFAIFAPDLASAVAFYIETFGLRVVLDNSRAAVPGYFLEDERGRVLEIIERPASIPAADPRYVCHVAFAVESVTEARARLEARGVGFEAETAIDTDEFKTAFFRDPAGNRCQIVWRREALGG